MEYIKKCEQCGKEYTSERSTSRFCSDACRVTFSRSVTKPVSVTPKTDISVTEATEAWQRVMNGEESGMDIGYGKDDYTREMVEDRLNHGDTFIPNWYVIGFKSKKHFLNGKTDNNGTL